MKLNLGCGENKLKGWNNHDSDVDIRKPLPFPTDSIEAILIEHCVEHITYYEAVEFLLEAKRVLKPGGVLRVIVPAIERIVNFGTQDYFDFTNTWTKWPRASAQSAVHSLLYCHGHKAPWTSSLMRATLIYVGFSLVMECDPNQSFFDLENIDGHGKKIGEKFNRIESCVFEARK
jgi:SAM-dependent methyltransferase